MPFDLELILSLESVMTTPHGYYTIQMSPSRQASYQNSTGLCTDLTTPFLLNDNRARYAVLCRPSMRPLREWSGPVQGGMLVPNYHLQRAVGVRLPLPEQWAQACLDDPETSALIQFVQNPGTISNKSLKEAKMNANYRAALRQSQIAIEDGILILREPIVGSELYARLQLVPSHFRNLVFIAFHSNPSCAHLNVTCTLHRIRLRFYWPGMYGYITRMCNACPGCALTSPPTVIPASSFTASQSKPR
jgi:hypothetical protein